MIDEIAARLVPISTMEALSANPGGIVAMGTPPGVRLAARLTPRPALKRPEMSCEQTLEHRTVAGASALDQMQGRLSVDRTVDAGLMAGRLRLGTQCPALSASFLDLPPGRPDGRAGLSGSSFAGVIRA